VPVGRWLGAPTSVREEGDTIILPVMEEVLVVEKRLRLVEEVHLVKHRQTIQHREAVSLRRETADVEQIKLSGGEVDDAINGDRHRPKEGTPDEHKLTPTEGEV